MDFTRNNTFDIFIKELKIGNNVYKYFDISKLNEEKYSLLPYSIRVILESAVRNCDEWQITSRDIKNILNWPDTHKNNIEIPFLPSRVILQDFTGIPAIVDLAAIRETRAKYGYDPNLVKPMCPVDLVIDNSLQVDLSRKLIVSNPTKIMEPSGQSNDQSKQNLLNISQAKKTLPNMTLLSNGFQNLPPKIPCKIANQYNATLSNVTAPDPNASQLGNDSANQILIESAYVECPFHSIRTECADTLERNQNIEFERSFERFQLLKWSSNVFEDVTIVPPGSGIAHQVNLESLARIVFNKENFLYPDSLIGTDSHTTLVNGIGVVGWGVGGIEAESVMLGQTINILLPQVIGYKIIGQLNELCTSTDVVLTIIKNLRQLGVTNKFVEFYGPGVNQLSVPDRETIANMCPEYGAIIGYFAPDETLIQHLLQTGRKKETVNYIKEYLKSIKLFREYDDSSCNPSFSEVHELDLSSVLPCVSGPKRPLDRTHVYELKNDFNKCLTGKNNLNGFGLKSDELDKTVKIEYESKEYVITHGSILIASINSCTNNSNPSSMLAAGILAKKATDLGLSIKPYIRTSLSPGSGVVTEYLKKSGLLPSLEELGFKINGYGCIKCINNIVTLDEKISSVVEKNNLITVGVLSGNRNFEGRINPTTKANYLASPPLAIAFAIAGRINIDFEIEPIGVHKLTNKDVYLRDIWPTRKELHNLETNYILPEIFSKLNNRTEIAQWYKLNAPDYDLFSWNNKSTYIKLPPFFDDMNLSVEPLKPIKNACVLLYLGDSITTDHISPAGSIARNSPAAKYLMEKGLTPREFNSYGSRRGNDEVMSRGTFANIRLFNSLINQVAPKTIHIPSGKQLDIYDAAELYKKERIPLIVLAGKEYGVGSSRDWVAKGQYLLGIRAILAESYDRTHRSALIGMGIIPLQFLNGQDAKSLKLTGRETFTIHIDDNLLPKQQIDVETNTGIKFKVQTRVDTNVEMTYIKNGGLLHYLLRKYL